MEGREYDPSPKQLSSKTQPFQRFYPSGLVFSMLNQSSHRKSFIHSSITTARLHGFQGLELNGASPVPASELADFGKLLEEWRAAITSEARNSSKPELLLVMAGYYLRPAEELGLGAFSGI
ncbi:hypothetical protein Ahy_A09g042841 [Arachis hypogaea]|uniref:GH18 domain-containing protein n=1 Tax=Arachis hypogaea TaxID=3818 RepID=A0A445BGW8_ARAHY|nr:hypothetical protein Ahy_A09g042841 [Arachis hypogaea]